MPLVRKYSLFWLLKVQACFSAATQAKANAKRQRPRAPIACVYGNFATENEVSDCHFSLDFSWKTHRDVDRFACPCRSYEQTRLLMRHQLLHQECIPHRVHSWHNDLVKRHFLRDGWRIFDFFSPQFPFTHPLENQNTGRQIHIAPLSSSEWEAKVEWKICLPLLQSGVKPLKWYWLWFASKYDNTKLIPIYLAVQRFILKPRQTATHKIDSEGQARNQIWASVMITLTSFSNQEILKTKNKNTLAAAISVEHW